MKTAMGPDQTFSNLVFYYDMGNTQKSWKGKPLTNYYGDISTSVALRSPRTQHFWDGKSWIVDATYSHPGVDGPDGVFLGLVYKHTSGALSSTWSGNSYGYMLKSIVSTPGNTYTMSSWTFVSVDCNITGLPCLTEAATTNNITISGYPTAYNLNAKGTWQRLARAAVSDGEVTWIPVYPDRTGVTDGSFTGFFMWAAAQVEDGSQVSVYAGSDVNYARSTTQSIIDLTGNDTITANSLTYASDGTFSFNGTSDRLTVACAPLTVRLFNSTTEFVVKLPTYSGGQRCIMSYRSGGGGSLYIGKSSGGIFSFYDQLSTPAYVVGSIADNSTVHVAVVCDSTNNLILHYINGVLAGSASRTGWSSSYCSSFSIGYDPGGTNEYMLGSMYKFAHYDRVLTASEIQQNFNAVRSRYGI